MSDDSNALILYVYVLREGYKCTHLRTHEHTQHARRHTHARTHTHTRTRARARAHTHTHTVCILIGPQAARNLLYFLLLGEGGGSARVCARESGRERASDREGAGKGNRKGGRENTLQHISGMCLLLKIRARMHQATSQRTATQGILRSARRRCAILCSTQASDACQPQRGKPSLHACQLFSVSLFSPASRACPPTPGSVGTLTAWPLQGSLFRTRG